MANVLKIRTTSGDVQVDYNGLANLPDNTNVEVVAPSIGDNGNWWIGDTDTGVSARGEDFVPTYVKDEAKTVADNVINARDAYSFVFGAISDTHTDGTATYHGDSILHAGMGLSEIHKRTHLDAVLNFGDVIWDDLTDEYIEGFPFVRSCLADIAGRTAYIHMQGNHDEYDSAYTEAEEKQKYFAYVGSNNAGVVTDWENRFRNYGYRDFEDQKMRIIYLNSVDLTTYEIGSATDCYISGAQYKWFINTALNFSSKSDAENWSFIVCCHHPLNWSGTDMGNETMAGRLPTILRAYANKTSGSVTSDNITTSYNFADAKAKFVAHFHGHLHNFRVETIVGTTSTPSITIPNACFTRNNGYGSNASQRAKWGDADENGNQYFHNKEADCALDTAFNVVVIDRTNQLIHCFNYGSGRNRVVPYGTNEVVYRAITNNLTNVTTSNTTGSVENGSSYSATLTAKDGYMLDGATVIITMGGTDITSSAYSNGVINIASVTGDVSITVAAMAVPKVYRSITNTLSNVTTSNNASSVEDGTSYSATLSAKDGYTLDGGTVTVTMGGTNITSSAYKNGVVTIASVTGDVKITATAVVVSVPKVYYSVTNTLSNVTTSNNASSVESGMGYSATLTAASGYTLTGGTVTITMGGTNITSSAYSNGVINITSVTGDVKITATAVSAGPSYTNLIDTIGYTDGIRLSTSSDSTKDAPGYVTTGYIPIESPSDIIRTKGCDFRTEINSNCSYAIYNGSKTRTTGGYMSSTTQLNSTFDSEGNVTFTVNSTNIASGGGFIRISGYGSGANLIVTKNQEIK